MLAPARLDGLAGNRGALGLGQLGLACDAALEPAEPSERHGPRILLWRQFGLRLIRWPVAILAASPHDLGNPRTPANFVSRMPRLSEF